MLQLHNYWRSTSSYRARLLLTVKGLPYDYVPVNIKEHEQHGEAYRRISPNGFVPTLVDGDLAVGQTVNIAEYLDETYPDNPLFPRDPAGKVRVRGFVNSCIGDVQPRTQKRVREYIDERFSRDVLIEWYQFWSAEGLSILENLAVQHRPNGAFFHGDTPGAADCFLVAQLYNWRRRDVDLSAAPTLLSIESACLDLPAFIAADPENQPDVGQDDRY
jgi:maleylacetoacetate isomerase